MSGPPGFGEQMALWGANGPASAQVGRDGDADCGRSDGWVGAPCDGILTIDTDEVVTFANPTICNALRVSLGDIIGSSLHDYVAPEDSDRVHEFLAAHAGELECGPIDLRLVSQNGRSASFQGSRINLMHGGLVCGGVWHLRNFSEALTAQSALEVSARLALAESEARYRTIVELAEEGIWMFDATGVSTFATPKLARMLGTTVEELIGVGYGEYSAGEEQRADAAIRWRRRKSGLTDYYETKLRGADGAVIDVHVAATSLRNADGVVIGSLAMITDLTHEREIERERAQLSAQREQDQRLASLGQLAGGVAHDFNNLLGIILNFARLAEQEVTSLQAIEDLSQIRHASERAATLTAQLLAFARRQVVNPELVAVNDLVSDFATMLGRTLGGQMDLRIELEHGVVEPIVLFDRNRLEHILLNLAINARDAMPDGGTATIRTAAQVGSNQISGWVSIRVTDDGIGMEPEVAARAFEPFFTTKEQGAGTGLGLATVHGLVAQGGGRVSIESTPGHGSTVEILLPLHAAASVAAVRSVGSVPSGTERILVVDDEPALLHATARILRLHDYDVIEAADGAQALAILDTPDRAIDLVLTDVSMKHMSGPELGAEIALRNMTMPVIYITGYNSVESGTTLGRVLHKPVAEATLLGAIRGELDRTRS